MNIQRLILYTSVLPEMRTFYGETLGLHMLMDRPRSFAVLMGGTQVEFHAWESPFRYHFAINIPADCIEAARDWLSARTSLLPPDAGHFVAHAHLEACSLYFRDPAGNLVELISREQLSFFPQGEFGRDHLAGISEIGLAVHSLAGIVDRVCDETMEPVYQRDAGGLVALGDVEGMLLFVQADKWTWAASGETACTAPCQFWALSDHSHYTMMVAEGEITYMQVVYPGG